MRDDVGWVTLIKGEDDIPAKAGIQTMVKIDSRLLRNDKTDLEIFE